MGGRGPGDAPWNEPITPLWFFFMSSIWPLIAGFGPMVNGFRRQIRGVMHLAAGEAECLGDSLVGDTQGAGDRSGGHAKPIEFGSLFRYILIGERSPGLEERELERELC